MIGNLGPIGNRGRGRKIPGRGLRLAIGALGLRAAGGRLRGAVGLRNAAGRRKLAALAPLLNSDSISDSSNNSSRVKPS